MNGFPMDVSEAEALAKLLAEVHAAFPPYVRPEYWDGYTARLYRETGQWAKVLDERAKREVERYEAGMRAG